MHFYLRKNANLPLKRANFSRAPYFVALASALFRRAAKNINTPKRITPQANHSPLCTNSSPSQTPKNSAITGFTKA